MMPENTWRKVRVHTDPETGERVVLLSGVFDGVRLWCEKHWSKPGADGERTLLHERFWSNDPGRVDRTAEAALKTATTKDEEPQHEPLQ